MSENATSSLISVIVPVYNIEPYLARCLESIINQTHQDLEIVVVEDGSTDNSAKICADYALKDSRIRVYHKQNGGLSSARNLGLDRATGAYIGFVDGDDWLEPDMFATLMQAMKSDGADCAACGYFMDYLGGFTLTNVASTKQTGQSVREFLRWFLDGNLSATAWSKLYKRTLFDGLRFPEGKLHEDLWVFVPILKRVQKLVVVNKALYHYIQRGSSIMGAPFRPERMDQIHGIESWFHYCSPDCPIEDEIKAVYVRYSWYLLVYMRGDIGPQSRIYAEQLIGIIRSNRQFLHIPNKVDSLLAKGISYGLPYQPVLAMREWMRKLKQEKKQ